MFPSDPTLSYLLFCLLTDPCLIHYCGKGRECIVQGQVAKCQCVRKCSKHLKSVCGDDGKLYPNHCELHRTSCVTNKPIYVDHSFSCIDRLHGEYDFNKGFYTLSLSPFHNIISRTIVKITIFWTSQKI